jgi:hypothetical protein
VVDLLASLGWWNSEDIDSILARVETLTKEVQNV